MIVTDNRHSDDDDFLTQARKTVGHLSAALAATPDDDMKSLSPCPFCGSEIKHVESWARSFNPPRLWHEWHHVADNEDDCPVRRDLGKIVASANDETTRQDAAIRRWNTRAPASVPSGEALDAAIHLINVLRSVDRDPVVLRFAEQDFETVLEKLRAQPASPLPAVGADATCYLERSSVREIVIGHNAATQAVLPQLDALPVFTAEDLQLRKGHGTWMQTLRG